jgi:altronate hydrolase
MKQLILKVNPKDNVLVALQNLTKGDHIEFEGASIVLQEDIPAKHKFYINALTKGSVVMMYGLLVGKVTMDVAAGARMSTDNLHHASEPYTFKPYDYSWEAPDFSKFVGKTFNGYHREDGRVGTANYWLFIPTVFCENRNLDVIKEALHNELGYSVSNQYKNYTKDLIQAFKEGKDLNENVNLAPNTLSNKRVFENIDGIKFLNHQGGCGGIRQDAAVLSKLLAAYADHPNVAGITVLSLGCQNLQLSDFEKDIKDRNPNFNKPLFIFEQQKSLSEPELIATAIKATFNARHRW